MNPLDLIIERGEGIFEGDEGNIRHFRVGYQVDEHYTIVPTPTDLVNLSRAEGSPSGWVEDIQYISGSSTTMTAEQAIALGLALIKAARLIRGEPNVG